MSTYVLVHGAWHTGRELAPVAVLIEAAGHKVFTPTIKGNGAKDAKTVGLTEAIGSIVDYMIVNDLRDVVLVGHSYGGIVITGVADTLPDRIRRLVYWNAFVPNSGESLIDMLPPGAAGDGAEHGQWIPGIAARGGKLSVGGPGVRRLRRDGRKETLPHPKAVIT